MGSELQGLKVKRLHVGGLPASSEEEAPPGLVGCVQVGSARGDLGLGVSGGEQGLGTGTAAFTWGGGAEPIGKSSLSALLEARVQLRWSRALRGQCQSQHTRGPWAELGTWGRVGSCMSGVIRPAVSTGGVARLHAFGVPSPAPPRAASERGTGLCRGQRLCVWAMPAPRGLPRPLADLFLHVPAR